MKTLLLLLFVFIQDTLLTAQTIHTGNITAAIKNENQQALENVTVQLMNSKDTSLVKVALTDNKGIAEFEHILFGTYLIKATMVNHTGQYSAPFTLSAGQSSARRTGCIKPAIFRDERGRG